jgi:hypothetical protein
MSDPLSCIARLLLGPHPARIVAELGCIARLLLGPHPARIVAELG